MEQIIVIGGGAAGIAAAISAAEQGAKVVLLEKNPRIGKKLLATGNGRCNLDHTGVTAEHYVSSDPQMLSQLLSAMGDPLDWFLSHGLLTRADSEGRIYPYSNQAADVLNLLLYWLERSGAEVRTDCAVTAIHRKNGVYTLETSAGRYSASSVICALGGQAGPQFGTEGDGSALMAQLGFRIQPEYPCLVALQCQQPRGLSGIRAKAAVTLTDGTTFIAREEGEVQFTDQGLSGIVIMQLSNYLRPKGGPRRPLLHLDLFPAYTQQQLCDLLRQRLRLMPSATAEELMTGFLHKRLGLAVWKAAKLPQRLSPAQVPALAHALKDWVFGDLTPLGWKQAQTTGGGMSLKHLDDHFQALPGLYVAGETLDAAGTCGGFNLHWAFGSGIIAGRHAARSNAKKK